MRRILLGIIVLISGFAIAQPNLKYSGFFDSYYTEGPIKFTLEPCLTKTYGDLQKGGPGAGIGLGANYQLFPALYLSSNFRYLSFSATDHDEIRNATYSGSSYQLNILADYHFVYDLIRTQKDRRRGRKLFNAYFSTGASLNYYTAGRGRTPAYHLPLILGAPIRLTPKFTLVPEIGYFMTFSDNFDDITGVGSVNRNDGYVVATVKLMFSPFDKRRKPKKVQATNRSESIGGGVDEEGFDDEMDDEFEMNETNFDDIPSEKIVEEEEEPVEETIEEEIIEEDDGFIDDEEDDGFLDEEDPEGEDEGKKYDEDGFLIDD